MGNQKTHLIAVKQAETRTELAMNRRALNIYLNKFDFYQPSRHQSTSFPQRFKSQLSRTLHGHTLILFHTLDIDLSPQTDPDNNCSIETS